MPESKLMCPLAPVIPGDWLQRFCSHGHGATYTGLSVMLSQEKCAYFDVFIIRTVSEWAPHVHTRALSLQNMITSSGVHVGQVTAAVNQRIICAAWFSLWGTSTFTRCSLDVIRKPRLAESQCLLDLSPAGKLSVLFLVHPLCGKMHQHFLKRKGQRLGVKFGGSVLAWGAETLASVPSFTNNSKQQLLGRSIFQ